MKNFAAGIALGFFIIAPWITGWAWFFGFFK